MLLELLLELLDGLRGHFVAQLGGAVFRAQRLSGVELDDLAARCLGLLDRFECGEPVEGVGLAADGEPADAVFGRDGVSPQRTSQGDQGCQSREAENREGFHEMGNHRHGSEPASDSQHPTGVPVRLKNAPAPGKGVSASGGSPGTPFRPASASARFREIGALHRVSKGFGPKPGLRVGAPDLTGVGDVSVS